MALCFDPCFVMTQGAFANLAPGAERKPRPVEIVFAQSPTLAKDLQSPTDALAVSPDFDFRPLSPVLSECTSESSQATEDTAPKSTIGFGRRRHSVLPTVRPADIAQSRVIGFGRKQHHRHSASVGPASSVAPSRKEQNRRSLPDISRADSLLEMAAGLSALSLIESAGRRVSDHAGGSRQPPRPLLLPQHVQERNTPPPNRVNRCLASVVSSRPVEFITSRLAAVRRLRFKRRNVARVDAEKVSGRKSLFKRLKKLYLRFRGL
ncbi:hypothetical protein C8R47DRAFT_233562 [Mycena vitilis]|nr:hypothetical protein C8R47DRAFT_233562 [Mycena vitilis]